MNTFYQLTATYPDKVICKNDYNSDIKILWTGGQDSTFRMIELSKHDITIQPYYLCDKRHSEQQELMAISSIIKDIEDHPETKCEILPLVTVKVDKLKPDESISKAYQRLYRETQLGSQFDWLARFAHIVPGLELAMEKSEMSKGYKCVKTYGKIKLINKGSLSYYIVDKEHSSDDLIKIFGNFHFPYQLFHTTKREEVEWYKKLGFEKTLNKTWFCHTPINNKPCGICHPCKSAIEEGLSFRLPASAIRRYKREIKYGDISIFKKWFNLQLKIETQIHLHFISPPSLLTNKALSHRI